MLKNSIVYDNNIVNICFKVKAKKDNGEMRAKPRTHVHERMRRTRTDHAHCRGSRFQVLRPWPERGEAGDNGNARCLGPVDAANP